MGVNPATATPGLHSCLYECSVMHHRLKPKEHQFRYNIFMFYLDLDELDEVAARVRLFGHNAANFYSFRDADHLTLSAKNLKQNLCQYLAEQGITFPAAGRIMLLTMPRVLGYIFNPVSFYFCFDAAGAPLCAVAEVGNTFGEIKPFLLRGEEAQGDQFRKVCPKHFYVSPFSSLELRFDFKLRVPGEQLEIHIDDRDGDDRVLLSALTGRRAPLTSASLAWYTLRYPLITLRVIWLIHWHALLLWWKKIPFHRKAANADLQRGVYRPHASLATPQKEASESRLETMPSKQ